MPQNKVTLLDLSVFPPPAMTTTSEITEKIEHLRGVLERGGSDTILLSSEGAVRWLTGVRHQVINIAPDARSPVQVLVCLRPSSARLTFFTARTEMPRVKDQVPKVLDRVPGIELDFCESTPSLLDGALFPGSPAYDETIGAIVRPIGGRPGHRWRNWSGSTQ